ncbi:helix-turn-helix domain-containing protein [Streptomyces rubiginosohelvolus]|uniref:helix-turn-helix domain-containing protein n=1 Tax=Streptomyces rubiginosohelvolus TaxID=67362 RepID=UPI0037A71EA0
MAGRPEAPIPPNAPSRVRELAEHLRAVRADTGMTYRELSRRSGLSTSVLSRALSGGGVPSLATVEALAAAAGLGPSDYEELRRLHKRASTASPSPAERVEAASRRDSLQFAHEMFREAVHEQARRDLLRELYDAAGRPPVRDLADVADLGRSTVHRALTQGSASARYVAESLLDYLVPETRDAWAAKIISTFEPKTTAVAERPLYKAVDAAESEEVDQAFREFVSSLRQVRNLIAHGRVRTGAQFAAHVMELASLVRNDRIHPLVEEQETGEPLTRDDADPSWRADTKVVAPPNELPPNSGQPSDHRGDQ